MTRAVTESWPGGALLFTLLPVPHVDEGWYAVEGGHHDVRHGEVQ